MTIVEFSDFECPFCRDVQPTLRTVFSNYSDSVRHVFRNYPLSDLHPGALDASMAGLCANEQNKFWEYHDALFDKAGDGTPFTRSSLRSVALKLGLDSSRFNDCLESEKYADRLQKDIQDAEAYGVKGTPTFFINNRIVSGDQPVEVFQKIIDEELNKSK